MGQPLGRGLPRVAHRVLGHQREVFGGVSGHPLRGIDNAFPHHTNEIAQSEAYLGHPWCKYWFHVLHLNDARGKMSKSKGDFLTVSLLEEKGYDPLAYRLFCLQSTTGSP